MKGEDKLLTAKLVSGEVISLGANYERLELQKLRDKENFFCRSCSERVILKLGTKRIFHFAHEKGASCTEEFERESEYHMSGKLKLFQWLTDQGISAELECYFPAIKQRADIAFQFEGKTYCLEYQCSTITEEILRKRTEGYRKSTLIPIWILGGKNIDRKKRQKISLPSFQYLFLKENEYYHNYLPAFCPQTNKFIFVENIIPISVRSAYCSFTIKDLVNISISELLKPPIQPTQPINDWKKDILRFKRNYVANAASIQDPFLHELYSVSLPPYFIPPFVGIPLRLNYVVETPPLIWQCYVFLEHFFEQEQGKLVTFHEVYTGVLKRVRSNQITLRSLPNINRNLLPFAIQEYLAVLVDTGFLKVVKNNSFVIDKPVKIANNMEEQQREEVMFYQQFLKSINS